MASPYQLLLDADEGLPPAAIATPATQSSFSSVVAPALTSPRPRAGSGLVRAERTPSQGSIVAALPLPGPATGNSGAAPLSLPPGRKAVNPARAANQQSQGLLLAARQKDKFVPLPKGVQAGDSDEAEVAVGPELEGPLQIVAYCLADKFDRELLLELLELHYPVEGGFQTTLYDDCVHLALEGAPKVVSHPGVEGLKELEPGPCHPAARGVFFFDFGVVVYIGLDELQQSAVMQQVVYKVMKGPLGADEVEVDQFMLKYSTTEPPHIKNDTFTVNTFSRSQGKGHTVQLAIAYALAQSIKLSVYEEKVLDLVEDTKDLPRILATTGKVVTAPKQVARLIGRVFLQNVNVNLLSSVLDTPNAVWSGPDHLQALYDRACEYLEMKARVELVNARFLVLQEMLDLLRKQASNMHGEQLELIVIFLLVVNAVLMLFQLLSLFGLIGH